MKATLLGHKDYDFEHEGNRVKGITLFFALENCIGIEGRGCTSVKVPFNNETKKYAYEFDVNSMSVGAPYELEYGTALDKDMKPVQRLVKIVRVK